MATSLRLHFWPHARFFSQFTGGHGPSGLYNGKYTYRPYVSSLGSLIECRKSFAVYYGSGRSEITLHKMTAAD